MTFTPVGDIEYARGSSCCAFNASTLTKMKTRTAIRFGQIPLPKGEGAAKRRVRGAEKLLRTPHPVLRTALSLRERDPQNTYVSVIDAMKDSLSSLLGTS